MKLLTDGMERVPRADARIGNILHDRVGGADRVTWLPTGKRRFELRMVLWIFELDASRFGTTLPDTHQPHNVESQPCERVPLCVGHFCEGDWAAEADGKFLEPSPGVDFVEVWVRANGKRRTSDEARGHRRQAA